MNKAFVKETDAEDVDEDDIAAPALPPGSKNYMTPAGYAEWAKAIAAWSGILVPMAGEGKGAKPGRYRGLGVALGIMGIVAVVGGVAYAFSGGGLQRGEIAPRTG
jgi:hypothetical protein